MATIAIVTSGIKSRSAFEVARRLRRAGHDVHYLSHDDLRTQADHLGIPFRELEGDPPHIPRTHYRQGNAALKALQAIGKLFTVRRRRRKAIADLRLDDFSAAIDDIQPDLFIIDCEMHAQVIAASSYDAPVSLITGWLAMFEQPGSPPLNTSAVPGPDTAQAWTAFRGWKRARLRKEKLRTVGADARSIYLELARSTGYPLDELVDDQWQIPFNHRTAPLIICNSISLDFPRSPLSNEVHVGPVILRDRAPHPLDANARQALGGIVAERERRDTPGAFIYCAFGTVFGGDDRDFPHRIAQNQNQPDVASPCRISSRLCMIV